MSIFIQDSTFSKSYSLHEALLEACFNATEGGGAYAWATEGGVKIIFEDGIFEEMINKGRFHLIVGIDEITNEKALAKFDELNEKHEKLLVAVFLHDTRGSLFHPKVSWFRHEAGGKVVVGSGNLTIKGLRENREVFSVIEMSKTEIDTFISYWNDWLSESKKFLKTTRDEEVVARARLNQRKRVIQDQQLREIRKATADVREQQEVEGQQIEDIDGWNIDDISRVLIAEIPKSGDRWNQVNFDIETFEQFFGVTLGDRNQRILLRSIASEGSLSEIESRPPVAVVSQNYRLELTAAAGIEYPEEGRPIGVFVEITTRVFIYRLFLPDDENHEQLALWLGDNWEGREDRMKRIVKPYVEVRDLLSSTPFEQFILQNYR